MPDFVLHRTFSMRTLHGHTINFEKGKPTYVPPPCIKDAIEIGAIPTEGSYDIIPADAEVAEDLSNDQRASRMFDAFEKMTLRTGTEETREDFNAQGLPNIKALAKLAGFTPTTKERNEVFQRWREEKAAA